MSKQLTLVETTSHAPVEKVEFHEVFATNYGLYGLHVVQERALPDARDGLKPVQRRILYTMHEGRYFAAGSHRKSAEIVGKVLGDRHPHGDSSVYDAMARMAQAFSLRYPFVDGQGNWGASDGSPAAAYRYTEAKLTPLAEALLAEDIKKETVPLVMTYKSEPNVLEPLYLPGHIPPCINPIDGIAVGISTGVPPHNLQETLAACIAMLDAGVLDGKPFTTEQLMGYLPGPDFPEGGRIMTVNGGLSEYLKTGKGRFTVRGHVSLEQPAPNKRQLVITALPPIGRDKVVASIIDTINERKLEGLVAEPPLDETNEESTRIVLELKRDANPAVVLEQLWQHTQLQINVSVQLYFLFADTPFAEAKRPKQVGMVELLTYWLHHQLDVLVRRLTFELRQFKTRLSTVEALILGAKNARPIVEIFQNAENRAQAKTTIQQKYKLSEAQSEVIASMSLSQVTRLDAGKYEAEKVELVTKISGHEQLLASRQARIKLLAQELKATAQQFGDARRTVIDGSDLAPVGAEAESTATLTAREPIALVAYSDNTVKVTPFTAFGVGSKAVKGDEQIATVLAVQSDDFVLAGTNKGRVFGLALEKLEVSSRAGKGESLARHLRFEQGERVVGWLSVPATAFDNPDAPLYLVEVSMLGKIKKTPVSDYKTAGNSGISSLKLSGGDTVIATLLSSGKADYLLTTTSGQTLRFSDDKLSPQGRIGQGQAAIALSDGARVVSADIWQGQAEANCALLVLTERGLIKRTPLAEYPAKGRATGGVATLTLNAGDSIVATCIVTASEQVLIACEAGSVIGEVASLPLTARAKKAQAVSWTAGGSPAKIVPLVLTGTT